MGAFEAGADVGTARLMVLHTRGLVGSFEMRGYEDYRHR